MKIAVEGCSHGELDKIYETLSFMEKEKNVKVDLLIICGDFQAIRNASDLNCMAVPLKYKHLNTFYRYYSGEKTAPVLTIFVGGNHEASNYLAELPYGGWVCPNIYYIGFAGVIRVGGLRIGGLSGIYKGADYLKGHFESPPYTEATKRSIYHIRNLEIFRLKQISQPLDIFISHDWPRGVYNYGNKEELLKMKEHFVEEVEVNRLGSRPAEELLYKLKPKYWFAAHLHCKFAALIPHGDGNSSLHITKFLALDKCLPRRQFLQILTIGKEANGSLELAYDTEWSAILRSTNHLLSLQNVISHMPGPGCSERWNFTPTAEELDAVSKLFGNSQSIPVNFYHTAAEHNPAPHEQLDKFAPDAAACVNPQTTRLCDKLGLTDPNVVFLSNAFFPSLLHEKDFSFNDEREADITSTSVASINPDDDDDDNLSRNDDIITIDVQKSPNKTKSGLSSECFVLDRTRHHSPSTCLSPQGRLQIHNEFSGTPMSSSSELKMDFPKLHPKDGDLKQLVDGFVPLSNTLSKPPQIVKKMKRRNKELYASQEDDGMS